MQDGSPVSLESGGEGGARTQLLCHFIEEEEYEPISNADALV